MQIFRFIIKNLDEYRAKFWLAVSASLVYSFASLSIPLLLADFTRQDLTSHRLRELVLGLAVAIVVSLGAAWLIRKYGEAIWHQFPNHLRAKYFGQLESQSVSQLGKYHTGYVLSMINELSEHLGQIIYDSCWVFAGVVANLGFLIYFTATQSWGLTILNLVLFLVFVVVSTILAVRMTKLADEMNRRNAVFSQYFVDFMGNILTVKRLGVRSFAENRLAERRKHSNEQVVEYQSAHANRWLLLHTIYFTANFLTIGYLLYEISKGRLAVGILILFLAFYGNLRSIIERVAENIITFTESKVYLKNLGEVIEPIDETPGKKPTGSWRQIQLENTNFQYDNSQSKIKVPKLIIERGHKICIYGTSGEGKTTLLNLISGSLTPQHGQRLVDNLPYEQIDRSWFTSQMAFISQEVELFNLSIRENLTLGEKISDREIWRLLEDLDLAAWAKSLDEDIETIVGEKGIKLSAGQKQRINLARGILLDRELYLLDEPTSHLDEKTEAKVVKTLKDRLSDKTVVIVTHRPAIKAICDQFYQISRHTVEAAKAD